MFNHILLIWEKSYCSGNSRNLNACKLNKYHSISFHILPLARCMYVSTNQQIHWLLFVIWIILLNTHVCILLKVKLSGCCHFKIKTVLVMKNLEVYNRICMLWIYKRIGTNFSVVQCSVIKHRKLWVACAHIGCHKTKWHIHWLYYCASYTDFEN